MADKRFRSCGSSGNLRDQFNALVDDYDELRTQLIALLAKLDGEVEVADDYESTLTPAAKTSGDLTE